MSRVRNKITGIARVFSGATDRVKIDDPVASVERRKKFQQKNSVAAATCFDPNKTHDTILFCINKINKANADDEATT